MLLTTTAVFLAGNLISALGPCYGAIMTGRIVSATPHGAFLGLAAGAYAVDPPGSTRAGANANVGVLYELCPGWGVEGVYSYHVVNTENDSLAFTALQVGVRLAF